MSWAGKYCRLTGDNCPGHSDPDCGGCPWWWEGIEENVRTGEQRIFKDCGILLQKRLLDEVTMGSRSVAAAIESTRNHVGGLALKAIRDAREQARNEAQPLLINGTE